MNVIAKYVIENQGEIDFVITGDSSSEILGYWTWVQKVSKDFGLGKIDKKNTSWGGLFDKLSEINTAYYDSIMEGDYAENDFYSFSSLAKANINLPQYFTVFDETEYSYDSHKEFMENFLGFSLRDDAFNFTESDCQNPMLMAHLRGLLADFEGRGYICGIKEYLALVTKLMDKKSYSESMIKTALHPYKTDDDILDRKKASEEFARDNFDLSEDNLYMMVASPFINGMERLDEYLAWRHQDDQCLIIQIKEELEMVAENKFENLPILSRFSGFSNKNINKLTNHSNEPCNLISLSGSSDGLKILRFYDPHKMILDNENIKANKLITGR
ncbi:hypothetical protein AB835_05615 [Candidatus Endobugula sertula]|uniref:Uncharacterized protein n=1 Tax=Candidatus Endobugula sertula TaxID=62101 RepID=A0A1D2QR43_9GAMM|nr:hypothetical protein AB835_05615 [Candidatus Endobugula sertula]